MMKDHIWRELNYAQRKTYLLDGLLGFLEKNLAPEKVRNVLHQLYEKTALDFLRTLQPLNFRMFLNQLVVWEKKYRHGRDSPG